MNQKLSPSSMLFASKEPYSTLKDVTGEELDVGSQSNLGIVSKSHNAKVRSANNRSKLNTTVHIIGYIAKKMLNVIQVGSDSVYVEIQTDTETMPIRFDGVTFHILPGHSHLHSHFAAIAWGLYWMSDAVVATDVEETRTLFKTVLDSIRGGVPDWKNDIYRFCDAFYYETALKLPKEYTVVDDLRIEEIKEAVRTHNYKTIDVLNEYPMANFAEIDLETTNSSAQTISPTDALFEKCKNGAFVIDSSYWDMDRRAFIPKLEKLDGFVPNGRFFTMVKMISNALGKVIKRLDEGLYGVEAIGNDYINLQMVGRPGTGKSTIADALGATFGLPVRVVANSKHTEEDVFTGMTKVQEGGFTFVETPFLDAYKNGGIILLEEYNLADPGVLMGALGQAVEKPFILFEDGYKEVRRHPLCIIIATMNTGTMGSREPSEAFTSRLPNVFLLDDPNDDDFINILKVSTGASTKNCRIVHSTYKRILDYLTSPKINEEQVALSITLRSCIAALQQMEIGIPMDDAISNTIIGTIAIKDIDLARRVQADVLMSYTPKKK